MQIYLYSGGWQAWLRPRLCMVDLWFHHLRNELNQIYSVDLVNGDEIVSENSGLWSLKVKVTSRGAKEWNLDLLKCHRAVHSLNFPECARRMIERPLRSHFAVVSDKTGFIFDQKEARKRKTIAKILVYKHCFCYINVENVEEKNPLFHQPIVLWLAY